MKSTTLYLRSETKHLERRSALSPASAKALLDAGFHVNVEHSSRTIYKDEGFAAVGATLVPEGSWPTAPKDHIIVGLKELPEDGTPLHHSHIQFGHCYKEQDGWATLRRCAASLLAWFHQIAHSVTPLGTVPLYPSAPALVADVKSRITSALAQNDDRQPRIIVIGALGRCGNGAVDFCLAAGVPESSILKWDMAETARGGPFPEISAADILINCVYLGATPIPPFVTRDSLSEPGRKLRVVCDVSCDPNSTNNPVPIYTEYSTFLKPTRPVLVGDDSPALTVLSIDHLPTLVAGEASDEFPRLLLPSLKTLDRRDDDGVWKRAEKKYLEVVEKLPA
ncbi:hypothetical protein DSL72_005190 [Monilinia vaccinii-corymbosi]|uniref:Saccharopine dehydrogenase [NAD(+), L-lysine-forming] n=1 Tax=Monilinia vaccinii-corymbosi TaxID=61207 RepID=A0A8A3PEI0_9HELO|nr:hypothetical protein DSL72_005190 [Monilinia vaccinii-corymbosi]